MCKAVRCLLGVFVLSVLAAGISLGQVAEGGFPMSFVSTKTTGNQFVDLPDITEDAILQAMEENEVRKGLHKAFRFALPTAVDLSPANSGEWFSSDEGYNIWRVSIRSANAKSLIVLFDAFKLSEGARLFLFNEDENHYLGAFTSANNKSSGKFAVSPVSGDEVTIQYEVPQELGKPSDFRIYSVNHDFVGILKSDWRRPLGESGDCNIDINCTAGDSYSEQKNAVCRLIVSSDKGSELCTGTLVNNTAQDQRPYIISAAHCYNEWEYAETTVFTFNYESPYCAPLDGDPSHSVSGAVMRAKHDSLDFALAEMSLVPPPEYRPYFAGWSHSSILPDSTVSIHHPYGDIKKIAVDNDPPEKSSFGTNSAYTSDAFLHIERWDEGVTEIGSSGGGLFSTSGQLIGTLTGGLASCSNPSDDYFASLAVYWDYRADSSKQVKCWLDPLNQLSPELSGQYFYEDEDLCGAFTHLVDDDEAANVSLVSAGVASGYWGGTNAVGLTEVMERFTNSGEENLKGVSLGVGKLVLDDSDDSEITVKVYDGDDGLPESTIFSKTVSLNDMVEDAMNYIDFEEDVYPSEEYFVGFELSNVQPLDTFVLYQSVRDAGENNTFYYKQDGQWYDFADATGEAMVNVMELVACNFDQIKSDTPVVDTPATVWIFPNPTADQLTIQSDEEIIIETLSVYNLLGQEINVPLVSVETYEVKVDLTGNPPGAYIVRFNYKDSYVSRKFTLMPY